MNINDNKLKQLMQKTERTIRMKKRRRKAVLTGALGTAAIALAVVAYAVFGPGEAPDVTINNPTGQAAATENSSLQPTPTPLPDGTTFDPDGGPTPVVVQSSMFEKWSQTQVTNGVHMDVVLALDEVSLPATYGLPVVQVAPEGFDEAFAKDAADYFMGGDVYKHLYTKSDYEKIYAAEKDAYESGGTLSKEEQAYADSSLKKIQDWMADAPEANSPAEFAYIDGSLRVKSYTEAGDFSSIIMHKGDERYGSSFTYQRGDVTLDYQPSKRLSEDVNIDGMTLDEALQLASETVAHFSENMNYNYSVVGHGYNPRGNSESLNDVIANDSARKSYIFYYTPSYPDSGGLSSSPDSNFTNSVDSKDLGTTRDFWGEEAIKVVIDKDGIFSFTWVNRTETVAVLQENETAIPPENAVSAFKDSVFNIQWLLNEGSSTKIMVSDLSLELVKVKSENGTYLMMPAYVFKGTQVSVTAEGYEFTNYSDIDNGNLLVINALNGQVIY
jgi:hypothetical protein